MTKTALCGGYAVLDVVKTNDNLWHDAGGTAANVAGNLAYLGWHSAIVGRLGRDSAGRLVRARLAALRVDVAGLELDARVATPVLQHVVLSSTHRYRSGCSTCGRGAAIHRPLSHISTTQDADVFFFDRPSTVNLALAELHRKRDRCVVYEPSTRATVAAHVRACAAATIVKYSSQRSQEMVDRLPARAPGQLRVVTYGSEGCDVSYDGFGQSFEAFAVPALDAGGAGDWMTAGLIHRLSGTQRPWDAALLVEAVEWSQAIAALSTLVPGARSIAAAVPRDRLAERIRAIRGGRQPHLQFEPPSPPSSRRCGECGLPKPRA